MLQLLNIAFFVFHTLWIAFNLVGWIWRRSRPWHLLSMSLTLASWFVLGLWYGWGYCPCTDWHWEVREKLGYYDEENNYIEFLLVQFTGLDLDPQYFNDGVVGITVGLFLVSTVLYWRDRARRKG